MFKEIEKLNNKIHSLEMDHWIQNDLFSFQWWIILIINITFFALLLIFIDRKRILQIAFAYMICYFFVCVSDDIGEYYGLWSYPHKLIPIITEIDVADFAVVPVTITLVYQVFKVWRKYIMAGIIISFILAFIGLPLFVYLGIIKLNNWNFLDSFLVLIVTCILVKIISDFVVRMNNHLNLSTRDDSKFIFSFFRSKKKAR